MIKIHWANMHNRFGACGRDMQLYKTLSATNNLSITKRSYTVTRNYHENSTRIIQKHFQDESVENLARLKIAHFLHFISKRLKNTLNICICQEKIF